MDVNYAMGQRPGKWSPDISPLLKQKNHGDHCCENHHDRFSRLTGTFPPGIYCQFRYANNFFRWFSLTCHPISIKMNLVNSLIFTYLENEITDILFRLELASRCN
jgi:hypothetical protein